MLDQAVQAFGQRFGGAFPILKQRAVSKNSIDVETACEVVRITKDAADSITLVGWSKVGCQRGPQRSDRGTYSIISGVYFSSSGWRFSTRSLTTNEYPTVKGHLPK
jgi:hypothetical protein